MAASTVLSRLSRRSSSLALTFASRSAKPSVSPLNPSSQSQISASTKRTSRLPRLPVQMSSLLSMMPLHTAIASARMKSILSIESQSWGLIPQAEDFSNLECHPAKISDAYIWNVNLESWTYARLSLYIGFTVAINEYLHAFMTDSGFIRIIKKFPPLLNGSSLLLLMKDVNPVFFENFTPRG